MRKTMSIARMLDKKAEEMEKELQEMERVLIQLLDRMEKLKMEMSEHRETIREFLIMKKSV